MKKGAGVGGRWQLGLGRENGLAFWGVAAMEAGFASYMLFWPLYIAALGANPAQVGLLLGAQGLLRLVVLAPSGYLVDRLPPVRLIVVARLVATAGMVTAALLPVWWMLTLPVVFLASGTVAFPAISAWIATAASDSERARAFALVYTIGPALATVGAPLLAGQFAEGWGPRAPLLVGAAFSIASVFFFGRGRPPRIHPAAGGQVGYRETLASPGVRQLCLLQFFTLLVLTLGTTLLPNFLRQARGLEFDRLGQLGSLGAVGSIVLGLLMSRRRLARRPLVGIAIGTASTVAAFILLYFGHSLWLYAAAFLLRGGYMVAWSLFSAALGAVTPGQLRGRAFALSELAGGAGFGLAPFIAGPLYEWWPAAPLLVATISAAPLLVVLLVAAARESKPIEVT